MYLPLFGDATFESLATSLNSPAYSYPSGASGSSHLVAAVWIEQFPDQDERVPWRFSTEDPTCVSKERQRTRPRLVKQDNVEADKESVRADRERADRSDGRGRGGR